MKHVEKAAQTVLLVLLVALAIFGLVFASKFIGWATNTFSGKGGVIYEVNIDMSLPAFLWSGVYGYAVRVPGFQNEAFYDLEGLETLEANLLFDCLETDIDHEVYASTVMPQLLDFVNIQPANLTVLDTFLGMDQYDSFTAKLSGTNTFKDNITIEIGNTPITIPATTLNGGDGSIENFTLGVLQDGNGELIFVAPKLGNWTNGFNGRQLNYQMILPIPNATEQRYYFFPDPYDICAEGEGDLPNPGNIAGIVTTEAGVPISDVIIHISNYNDASDTFGFYNITAPEGQYTIFAIKSGYDVYANNVSIVKNQTTIHNIILVQAVTPNDFTGIGPGRDVGPGDDVGPGEAPLVPQVEQPKRVEGTDIVISLNTINRKLRLGNFLQEEIVVYSYKEGTTQAFFKVTGDIANLVELDKNKLLVAPNERGSITPTIFGRGELGTYNGTIEITGDFNASIPLTVELISANQLPVQALLMELDSSKKQVHPNEDLQFKTDLKNLLSDQEYPVSLFYTIQDETGNTTLWTYSTNVLLKTSFSLLKTVKIPKDAPRGVYIIRVTANYLGFSAGTSEIFEVVTPFWQLYFFGLFFWQWGLIIGSLLTIALIAFIIWKKMDSNKRFHLKVDYTQLPKPGPRSGWWGKIAETDHKTYFDLDQLKIHSIVAGSTGGGKSISAQVIIEECLLKDVAVIAFDPTAQWSGMLRPCKEKGMLKYYPGFGMKPKDAKAFNGNVKQITNPREVIEIQKNAKPGEIQIYAMNKLDPKGIDLVVANTIRQIFDERPTESEPLKLMIIYDEIHRILPKFGGSGDGFVQIERGCREFRKWGIGIMLVSQVLADFVGQIKANINTEVQMRTRDEGDLDRIKTKYGDSVLKSLVKASVGSGMVQNASYNRGQPYFVTFRPILHSVQRLTDEELEKYNKYNDEIDQLVYELEQLEELEIDVFDMKLELKLSLDKVKVGNFNMVEVYLEGLRPRVKKNWEKIGKVPKKKEKKLVSEDDFKASINAAKQSREEAEAVEAASGSADGETVEVDLFRKEVSPDKILSLVNGMLVISLKALYDELSAMKQSDYDQHVNKEKNEFADWVKDAVGDKELAQHMMVKPDKQQMLDLIDLRSKKQKLPELTDEEKKLLESEKWFDSTSDKEAVEAVEEKEEKEEEAKLAEAVEPEKKEPITEQEKAFAAMADDDSESEVKPETAVKEEAEEPVQLETSDKKELEEHLETETKLVENSESRTEKKKEEEELDADLEKIVVKKDISSDQYFRLQSGKEIKSVLELVEYLRETNDDDFKQYVSNDKNDFASWVRGVFHNDQLADRMQTANSKDELINVLQEG